MNISNEDFDSMLEAIRKRMKRLPEASFILDPKGERLVDATRRMADSPGCHAVVTGKPGRDKSVFADIVFIRKPPRHRFVLLGGDERAERGTA